ncbi:MAG: hypothetical protein ACOYJK_04910 [Prevotella sp.]|jgi:hypothetical protein
MRLYELLQAYEFNEIMPVITEMFPGTGKYQKPLQKAYDILLDMKPVSTKKEIKYRILSSPDGKEHYMGAEDRDFDTTWEVCLGKNLTKEKGVDLSDIEMIANALVNICFIARHPHAFDQAYAELTRPER